MDTKKLLASMQPVMQANDDVADNIRAIHGPWAALMYTTLLPIAGNHRGAANLANALGAHSTLDPMHRAIVHAGLQSAMQNMLQFAVAGILEAAELAGSPIPDVVQEYVIARVFESVQRVTDNIGRILDQQPPTP